MSCATPRSGWSAGAEPSPRHQRSARELLRSGRADPRRASRSCRRTPQRWNSPPTCCSRASSTPWKPGCRCSTATPDRHEADLADMRAAFEAAHRQIYGYVLDGEPVEIQSHAARRHRPHRAAGIPAAEHARPRRPRAALQRHPAGLVRRRSGWRSPVYDGARLSAGHDDRRSGADRTSDDDHQDRAGLAGQRRRDRQSADVARRRRRSTTRLPALQARQD